MDEQERARESQARGKEAARISDPETRREYIRRQGEKETFERARLPFVVRAFTSRPAMEVPARRVARALKTRAKKYRR